MDEWFDDVIVTGTSQKLMSVIINQEVKMHLTSNRDESDSKLSLLEWWKKNQFVYAILSALVKQYLAIPASSVPSELVFSFAGLLVNKEIAP